MEELLIWEEITELRELNSLSVFVRLMLSMTREACWGWSGSRSAGPRASAPM